MKQGPDLVSPEARRARKVGTSLVVALAAVAMTAENSSVTYGQGIRPPEFIRTDQRLTLLGTKMEALIKQHDRLAFKEIVSFQGKKTEQLTLSHLLNTQNTGKKSYVQVVLDKPIGQYGYDNALLVVGATSPKFHNGEKFDRLMQMTINSDNYDQYLLWDYHRTNGVNTDFNWFKSDYQNSFWSGKSRHEKMSEGQIDQVFDIFTDEIIKIGSVGNP